MAPKPKKGKPSSQKNEATKAKPWPEIPQQLACLFSRQCVLMKNISYGGVTKSWRESPRRCNPLGKSQWSQLYDTNDRDGDNFHRKPHPQIFNIKFNMGNWWVRMNPPQLPLLHVIGYSRGEVIDIDLVSNEFYIYEPVTRSYWASPPWDSNVPFKCATQYSLCGNDESKIVIVLTGISKPAFMFYSRGGSGYYWRRCDCTVLDPYDSNQQLMKFTNVVEFRGKFYAISLQGSLAVIEEIDSQLRITSLGTNRAVPLVFSRRFREYLFVSNGEVLLVFLISIKSTEIVDGVEIFRLHFGRLAWEKMENLGDRTLFVGATSCVCVTSSKVGCKRNCIYFTQITLDGWWVFDMEKGNISPGWSDIDYTTKSPLWDVPMEDGKKLSFVGYFGQ